MTCSLCDKPVFARGWCSSHYHRWYRHGDPLAGRIAPGEPLATLRIWVAERFRDEGCWTWPWAENGVGYGVVNWEGRQTLATHVALHLDDQPRSEGLEVLHSCDNPPCVNPAHLRWGTRADNMRDASTRNRLSSNHQPKGEEHANSLLTAAEVVQIRAEHARGVSKAELTRRYPVGRTQVVRIIRRESWQHVRDPEVLA